MLPPLPTGSRIQIGREADGWRLVLQGSRWSRWLVWIPAAFLLFWLGGWYSGEKFALREILQHETPLGAKLFLLFWLAGWTVGGLGAAIFAVGFIWRRGEENLHLRRTELLWTPPSFLYALLGSSPRQGIKTFRYWWKYRSFNMPLPDITSIEIKQGTGEDTTRRLAISIRGRQFYIGTELSNEETDWLLKLLRTWQNSPGQIELPHRSAASA